MNHFDDARLDATLQAFLVGRAEDTAAVRDAHEMSVAIARHQDRGMGRAPVIRFAWVVVAVVLLGALAIGTALLGGQPRPVRLEAMTVTQAPAPTEAPTPTPAPTEAPTLTPASSAGDGPMLTWSRVDVDEVERAGWFGGRFYLGGPGVDVLESEDGIAWRRVGDQEPSSAYGLILSSPHPFTSWEGDVVQWDPQTSNPVVRVFQPPSSIIESRDLDRHDNDVQDVVYAVGIGPTGVVAATESGFDYEGFALRVLGQDWFDQLSMYGRRDADTLIFRTHDGRSAEFQLSDVGLTRADFLHDSSGWYSADGLSWTQIPRYQFPGAYESNTTATIAGTADGFLLQHANGWMWHSPDGMTWSRLADTYRVGTPGWSAGSLIPWGSGALATDGANRFDLWTADGRTSLPLAAALPERDPAWRKTGAGPLGIVVFDPDRAEVLFSPDGSAWNIAPMPPEMARFAPDSYASKSASVAVGSEAVVVVLWDDLEGSSVWRGTVAP